MDAGELQEEKQELRGAVETKRSSMEIKIFPRKDLVDLEIKEMHIVLLTGQYIQVSVLRLVLNVLRILCGEFATFRLNELVFLAEPDVPVRV